MFKKFKKAILSIKDLSDPDKLLKVINGIQQAISDTTDNMVTRTQNNSIILENISLVAGKKNIINHKLGRKLQGWQLSRVRSEARVWDTQDSNPSPNLTLWLHAGIDVSVDIEVY